MVVRLLDAVASDFASMSASDLKQSIASAEGRTVAMEAICSYQSPVEGVSHGEIGAAMGADIVILDRYDSLKPVIQGAPDWVIEDTAPLARYRELLGRPVGVNLIVADAEQGASLGGRLATAPHIQRIIDHGVQIITLYVRPKMGGTLDMMLAAASTLHELSDNRVLLIGVPSFSKPAPRTEPQMRDYQYEVEALLQSGCDGIGLPMPGTKQGWEPAHAAQLIDAIHTQNGLAWLFLTGSVEGAPTSVMAQLALMAKQIGADACRLDEAGLSGMPPPENILAFSLALRGQRHTYRRMAASIRR